MKANEKNFIRARVARNLRRYRIKRGIKQDDLGAVIGKDRSTIANYERAHGCPPLPEASLLCRALGITLDELVK